MIIKNAKEIVRQHDISSVWFGVHNLELQILKSTVDSLKPSEIEMLKEANKKLTKMVELL